VSNDTKQQVASPDHPSFDRNLTSQARATCSNVSEAGAVPENSSRWGIHACCFPENMPVLSEEAGDISLIIDTHLLGRRDNWGVGCLYHRLHCHEKTAFLRQLAV